jgi:D-alanyl-D-alanine endopeptidase (penicillin-binding protein 7)
MQVMTPRKGKKKTTKKSHQFNYQPYLFGLMVVGLGVFGLLSADQSTDANTAQVRAGAVEFSLPKTKLFEQLDSLDLMAESVVVYDINQDTTVYDKAGSTVRPLASLTKIMTALAVMEYTQPDTQVTLTQTDIAQPGDNGLLMDSTWAIDDLVKVMLVTSSNDAAYGIQRVLNESINTDPVFQNGVDRVGGTNSSIWAMNSLAKEYDLENSVFVDAAGLDQGDGIQSGSFGTAADIAYLIAELWKQYPKISRITTKPTVELSDSSGREYTFLNTNEAIDQLPGLVASKTGYTDLAKGNLAVVVVTESGDEYAIVVMGSGYKERFQDVVKITDILHN